jgi:hypothetical protein
MPKTKTKKTAARVTADQANMVLILLCCKNGAPQKGQLESCRRSTRAIVCRSVAIERGLCRWTRTGRAPRAELGRHFGDG